MLPVPAVAVPEAETVAVAVDPDLMLAGLKVTVTPAGAVADKAMELVNPVLAETPTENVVVCP